MPALMEAGRDWGIGRRRGNGSAQFGSKLFSDDMRVRAVADDLRLDEDDQLGSLGAVGLVAERIAEARDAGLRGAFGFPVIGSGGPIGVMTFLGHEVASADEALQTALATVGRQIGLFVERRNAEETSRRCPS